MTHSDELRAMSARLAEIAAELEPIEPPDTVAPTVEISDDVLGDTAKGRFTAFFQFSEEIDHSFSAADIKVDGADAGILMSAGDRLYALEVIPPADTSGIVIVSVDPGRFKDLAGNLNTEGAIFPRPFDTVVALPPPPIVDGQFARRYQHPQLFQTVSQPTYRNPDGIGTPVRLDIYGPNKQCVAPFGGWVWDKLGGDWLDANLVRHGSTPWAEVPATAVQGSDKQASYDLDVTALVQRTQDEEFQRCPGQYVPILVTTRGTRPLACKFSNAPPLIIYTYPEGDESVECTISAAMSGIVSESFVEMTIAPLMLEFPPPRDGWTSAALRVMVRQHWMQGGTPAIMAWLIDPPINSSVEIENGTATPIFDMRFEDGRPESDFIIRPPPGDPSWKWNVGSRRMWSDEFWIEGAEPDPDLFPHRAAGRICNVNDNISIVDSSYADEGFKPLAPGIGAMRIAMPATHESSYQGTLACEAKLYLPADRIGVASHVRIRQYVLIGSATGERAPFRLSDFKWTSGGGSVKVSSTAGKCWWSPNHNTTAGGYSGSAGGGRGWQMRGIWTDSYADEEGPDWGNGALAVGFHLYDFMQNNPPGYVYGGTKKDWGWGEQGGHGPTLQPFRWYCMETELKLNSVDQPGRLADGSLHIVNGQQQYWTPDGELRAWIDGVKVWEDTGMVFRSLPVLKPDEGAYDTANSLYGIRELGVREVQFNWYCGGTSPNTIDRVIFSTGLAVSEGPEPIGPLGS